MCLDTGGRGGDGVFPGGPKTHLGRGGLRRGKVGKERSVGAWTWHLFSSSRGGGKRTCRGAMVCAGVQWCVQFLGGQGAVRLGCLDKRSKHFQAGHRRTCGVAPEALDRGLDRGLDRR